MGTRRSKHHKGRKPSYKDHDRTTLADIAPAESDRWENETADFLWDRRLNDFMEARAPQSRRVLHIAPPNPALVDPVKAYIERRKAERERHDILQVFPDVKRNPERISAGFNFVREADHVEASRRDVLMEMFVERKITHGQMHAGRCWQANKERATLQPSRSIDWSSTRRPYQARGEISGGQWGAMKWRRDFVAAEGLASAMLLDFLLDADRGRRELVRIMGVTAEQIERVIDDLLTKICRHFAKGRSDGLN